MQLMLKLLMISFLLIVGLCQTTFSATHLFWSNVLKNGYDITDSTGPNLDIESQYIHEDTLVAKCYNFRTYKAPMPPIWFTGYYLDLSNAPRIIIYPNAFNKMRGQITSATLRAEIMDPPNYWKKFKAGPIRAEITVIDLTEDLYYDQCQITWVINWAYYGRPVCDTILINAPASRGKDTLHPSPLARQFIEIPNLKNTVQYILNNNDNLGNKHLAILFTCFGPMPVDTGSLGLYTFNPACFPMSDSDKTENMWTTDGNTLHFIVEGDLPTNPGVGVEHAADSAAASLALLGQNYPNPFNPTTRINYNIPRDGGGRLAIFSVDGKIVKDAVVKGRGVFVWQADKMASGVYYCRLSCGAKVVTRAMVLMR